MIRRPPRSTLDRSSAASDVYKRQVLAAVDDGAIVHPRAEHGADRAHQLIPRRRREIPAGTLVHQGLEARHQLLEICLLYTSDAADERSSVDLGGRRII